MTIASSPPEVRASVDAPRADADTPAVGERGGRVPLWVPVMLVVSVCALSCFAGLGSTPLWEPDEPRFAEATRQMLLRGDFLTPWFNARPRFEKPILFYWLQLPFFFGLGPTELAARAPAAIAGLLTVLATFALASDLASRRAGLLASLCLATTFRFVLYARQGLTDIPVVAAITCGIWAMNRALRDPAGRGAAAWMAWACAGAGVLLKGPVGLLAPVVWSLWALSTGGWRRLRATRPLAGVAIVGVIALPWYAAMWALHGDAFVDVALRYEVIARYVSPAFPGPNRGFTYFWSAWLGDALPWSLFFIPAIWWAATDPARLRAVESASMRLAAIWFTTVLLIFSVSEYKLPHYILPAYPAMALAIGVFADAAIERQVVAMMWQIPFYLTAIILAAGAVLLWLLTTRVFEPNSLSVALAVPVLLAGGALAIVALTSRPDGSRFFLAFSMLAVLLAVCYGVLGTTLAPRQLSRFQPAPAIAAAIRAKVPESDPLAVGGGYRGSGLVFYARRPVQDLADPAALVAFLSRPGPRWAVLQQSALDEVRPLVPRRLRVAAEAPMFSVRMKRLLERTPEESIHRLVLVRAE